MPNRFAKNRVTGHILDNPTDDNIYVDIVLKNDTTQRGIPIRYEQTRTEPIIDNPSNYYLSLARWNIPAFALPIFIMPIADITINPWESSLSVTLEYDGNIEIVPLFYTVQNGSSSEDPNNVFSKYYFIYYVEHLMDMINFALITAFNNLPSTPVDSEPPQLIYESGTQLFSLTAQKDFYLVDTDPIPATNTQPTYDAIIKIYFNYDLYQLFAGIPSRSIPIDTVESLYGRDAQILIQDFGNNTLPNDYLSMVQDFVSVSNWNPVKQLLFLSNLLPIKSEYTNLTSDSFRKILTNFEPLNNEVSDIRTTYQYYPQARYRLIDLTGTNPLYRLDLYVKWVDIYGNEYDLEITSQQQFSAKLIFIKRNLYKSDNLLYEH